MDMIDRTLKRVMPKKRSHEVGDMVWYKGKKAVVADRGNLGYALWNEDGEKEIKGEIDTWWIPGNKLSKR